jgi:integrase
MIHFWIEENRNGTFTVRWRDGNKKKYRDSYQWSTRREATKRRDVLEHQDRQSALGIYKEVGFRESAQVFMRLHGPRLANDATRRNYQSQFDQLILVFGDKLLSKITYQDIASYWDEQIKAGFKRATVRRRTTLLHNLYERFKFWNGMVPELIPEKVALPEMNPASLAMEYLGNRKTSTYNEGRKRRLSEVELSTAKAWCLKNDPELWEAMKLAIWTALRKSDMKKLKTGESVNLIQEKTGNPQIMPITLKDVPTFGNLMWRWNILRGAMGWLKKGTPLHTTWHDLRHCAPSMMADEGFSTPIIAQYLGHSSEKMAKNYTHPSGKALIPAVEFLERKLEAL